MIQYSNWLRKAALVTGVRSSEPLRRALRSVNGQFEIGVWLQFLKMERPTQLPTKWDLFSLALQQLRGGNAPLYLEFGVYRGDSLRWWLENLTTPSARFIGFDSFQGLPHYWIDGYEKGHFATSLPEFSDKRAELVVGLFDETLPQFELPISDRILVNFDADLYTSIQCVLNRIGPDLRPRDLIYFDEFHLGEQRALSDYLSNSRL